MTTREDVIRANWDKLIERLKKEDRNALSARNTAQISIYIWEDGEIETLWGSGWLQAKEWEPRALYYVATVESNSCSLYDICSFQPCEELEAFEPDEFARLKAEYSETLEDPEDYYDGDLLEYIREHSDMEDRFFELVLDNNESETDYEEILERAIERE